jgi:putative transposase
VLLDLVNHAVEAGWSTTTACAYLGLPAQRYYRWETRAAGIGLADLPPGGNPMGGLLEEEKAEILRVFDEWSDTDRSHRKLAHRGSYLGRFWASPSTVRRVLFLADKRFKALPRPGRSKKKRIPDWVEYRKNQVWIYDTTHFMKAEMAALAIMDLVTRKWLAEVVSNEETSAQVELGFERAITAEDLERLIAERLAEIEAYELAHPDEPDPGQDRPPLVLLAMSDNGPQMRSDSTAEYMAAVAFGQHFGRPGTPTDQAEIETLFGHIKREYPHLTQIEDPATLRAELKIVRAHYNTVRLHESLGYVTPDDEHEGRGPAIRKARTEGLKRAHRKRVATRRRMRQTGVTSEPPM